MTDARDRVLAAGFSRDIDAAAKALAALGRGPVVRVRDGASALRGIASRETGLMVSDAILPGMDGSELVHRTRKAHLNTQPAVLLIVPPGLRLPGAQALESLGARTIAPPVTVESVSAALEGLEVPLPPEKTARLKRLLDALGVPVHPGRECLERAVALAWSDRRRLRSLKGELYPPVSKGTGMSIAQVERALRHAIDVAWREGAIEEQHRIFGDTIDARRGKPTCGEMIAQLADILRWEG